MASYASPVTAGVPNTPPRARVFADAGDHPATHPKYPGGSDPQRTADHPARLRGRGREDENAEKEDPGSYEPAQGCARRLHRRNIDSLRMRLQLAFSVGGRAARAPRPRGSSTARDRAWSSCPVSRIVI